MAAITAGLRIAVNKRLGHALALVKAQQDTNYQPQMKTNSEKIGYRSKVERSTDRR
jgi:hypothetical protein